MTTRITIVAATASLLGLTVAQAQLTGRQIMEEQKKRHELQFEQETVDMILTDKNGQTKERSMVSYSLKGEDGLSKVLLQFLAPRDIEGVGLLTWEQGEDKDDDQWLYLPALKKVKRIASGGKKNKFMGTDLAFEDLRPENLSAFNYNLKDEVKIDGHPCHVIEATPATDKQTKQSGYGKRVLYVRKDIVVTIKTEFFDKKERLIKVGTAAELVNIRGDLWRGDQSVMEDVKKKTSTTMKVTARDVTTEIDSGFFTQRNLKKTP